MEKVAVLDVETTGFGNEDLIVEVGVVELDLGTGATTRVNGRPTMKAHLKPGDELTIGTTRLVVNYQASVPPLALGRRLSTGAHTAFAH